MAELAPNRGTLTRTLASLALVFGLLHLANTSDILSDLTRPVVVGLLRLLGVAASDQQGFLRVGRLEVPWSRDCAGLNILTILWAITLWMNRAEPLNSRYWLRLALALPAGLVANIARILMLIAYRRAFFPSVESPQLHYFIGFLWLIPFLGFFVPRAGRPWSRYLIETLYLAAVLSLLAPYVPSPGGSVAALCTLVFLAPARLQTLPSSVAGLLTLGWLASGFAIGLASMESLWIPWMLACPRFVSRPLLASIPGLILLAGTIPLFAMQTLGLAAVVSALAWLAWDFHRRSGRRYQGVPALKGEAEPAPAGISLAALLASALFLPFVASSLSGLSRKTDAPPAGAMHRQVDIHGFEIRVVGQPPDLSLVWYGPYGDGRHHSLPVCMRFRGILLRPSGEHEAVMTDGRRWMREFFLQGGDLVPTYPAYLRRTFSPVAPPGVHLIFSAPTSALPASAFALLTERTARALLELDRQARAQVPARSSAR